jgi:hypothetical protein
MSAIFDYSSAEGRTRTADVKSGEPFNRLTAKAAKKIRKAREEELFALICLHCGSSVLRTPGLSKSP